MAHAVSPLAPTSLPDAPAIAGVRFATAEAGIKYRGRTDVLLVALDEGTEAAGVFTRSKCPSAAVDWCRENLAQGRARALLVNSGNANAFTGRKGRDTVRLSADHVARVFGIDPATVFLASTGVIGEPLDPAKFGAVLDDTAARLAATPWIEPAKAIMTTDTFPKVATRTVDLGGVPVTINGVAKGAGMIAPDMATMLSFVFTDAPIAAPVLQALLSAGVETSFNAITVDSDTSTSDTLMLFATQAAAARGAPRIEAVDDPRLAGFRAALHDLLQDLAHLVVKDGEGATKFVEITVTGATSDVSAKRIGLSIANSPLVKTAIAGEDANWGRIVMAVGKAGEPADRDRIAIWFGDTRVAVEGERDAGYSEAAATAAMQGQHVRVRVDLGLGDGVATVWTCDLTKEYVAINGDYRS
ncbi:bifunctional glutamate N-acetyltransferase/amino-acid acetyltransferase ArgJ [Mongoliimonas terrestris]|uniref:bifunctional glutamate N-acetyltransferase/amino-acid acetyltransferase ArgJ n=1 Tax=Mongoliimonas terrestris TaxID=1709001 RepID=UPI000949712E|nr:bifunctional glutamate N-acetyltransferase/amino-acid acetyltransferase ArgJ [Mongoliimonas terrestris]